ncbi:hypothetical protein LY76DRAFT_604728 [Colletotrichum caudatum]|nr:hypothetical protein LY76DRAFT_604728 [Colletotrichum caudatum]
MPPVERTKSNTSVNIDSFEQGETVNQHTTGIMKGGYSRHWPRDFLPRTTYSHSDRREGLSAVGDSLIFKCLNHFQLHGDAGLSAADRLSAPAVVAVIIGTGGAVIEVSCAASVAQIEPQPGVASPFDSVFYSLRPLEDRFPREEDLKCPLSE